MSSGVCQPARSREDISLLAKMAEEIWTEHYAGLLSGEQIGYMVEKLQSERAIGEQLAHQGYAYYFLMDGEERAGYLAIQRQGDGRLFLSKLYLYKERRGKRIASRALAFLEALCREEGLSSIWLTVNRGNAGSVAVYQRLGFRTVRSEATDIGSGFVMDDYIMEKPVL